MEEFLLAFRVPILVLVGAILIFFCWRYFRAQKKGKP
jgi:hypothetical protein